MLRTTRRLALGLAVAVPMLAISCIEVPPCSRLDSNAVFFRGRVLDTKASLSKRINWVSPGSIDMHEIRYLVTKGFWGIATGQVVTVTDVRSPRQGTVEFVEAWREQARLVTNECGSGDPAEMIKLFRLGPKAMGSLTVAAEEAFAGATLAISGMAEKTATIGKEASKWENMAPGQYHIRVLQTRTEQPLVHEVVNLPPGGCPFVLLREASKEN